MVTKNKQKINKQVTGRTVAYIQTLDKSGKLGVAKPFVVTTVNATPPTAKPVKTSKKKNKK